jgi:hypothetical protein
MDGQVGGADVFFDQSRAAFISGVGRVFSIQTMATEGLNLASPVLDSLSYMRGSLLKRGNETRATTG